MTETDAVLAARHLIARTPFSDRAIETKQHRVRLLFTHFSDTALEIVIQFLRVFFFEGMGPTRVDVICSDQAAALDRICARAPNLRHMLQLERDGDPEPLRWAGRIHLHAAGPMALGNPSWLAAKIADDGPLTAIVIASGDERENMSTALAIRPWTAATAAFAAPIYVEARTWPGSTAAMIRYDGPLSRPADGLLTAIAGSRSAGDVIEPFGMADEIRSPTFLNGRRERLAKMLHAAYRQRRLDALSRQGNTERTRLPDWDRLDETYRQANRRAVDFIPSLRLVAGMRDWWNAADGVPRAWIDDPARLESLSRMVHHSWRADREIDGWRYASVRDSVRRLHTDLVDYDALSAEKKELDREQIRLLAELPAL